MARKKPVVLSSGLKFDSIGQAQEHFKTVLNSTPVDSAIVKNELCNVLALYSDYCSVSPVMKLAKER